MKVKAYAKINLVLDIFGKDLKTGYHEMWTIFQQIDLHDVLEIKKISAPDIGITSNDPHLPINEKNTVYKAIKVLAETLGGLEKIPTGVHVAIEKNIPVAAGLGGGSSDAAETLKALNELWKLNLSLEKLEELASKIGMDVPFFIRGGTSVGNHYGEKIQPLPPLKKWCALLVDPGTRMSSSDAYSEIDHCQNTQDIDKTRTLLRILKNPDISAAKNATDNFGELIHNDFDRLYREKLQPMYQKLHELKAQKVTCTGSGSFHFAVFKNEHVLRAALKELEKSTWKARKIQARF